MVSPQDWRAVDKQPWLGYVRSGPDKGKYVVIWASRSGEAVTWDLTIRGSDDDLDGYMTFDTSSSEAMAYVDEMELDLGSEDQARARVPRVFPELEPEAFGGPTSATGRHHPTAEWFRP